MQINSGETWASLLKTVKNVIQTCKKTSVLTLKSSIFLN